MAQLPIGSIGSAVLAVLIAVVSLFCAGIMIWLTWHHEKYSYVALIGWFSIITTLATLTEQAYYITAWRDVFTADYIRKVANINSAHPHLWIALTFGMTGLDLAMFWIMMCGYTIQSLLIMFWAIELATSVYGLAGQPGSKLNKSHKLLLRYCKIVAIVLPIIIHLLLQIPEIQNTDMAWFIMTHSILLGSVIISIIVVSFIFTRYFHYRKKLRMMLGSSKGTRKSEGSSHYSGATSTSANHHGLYDRWLLPRFGVIIVALIFFEAFNISIQINNWRLMRAALQPMDLSARVASWMMFTSVPRCLPGIALLLIFGTTKVFRARLYRTFWPKRWQRYDENTPLETPYQSSKAGRKWYMNTDAPKIDLKLTSVSLRWDHSDKTFAGWESRPLENPRGADRGPPFSPGGSTAADLDSPVSSPWDGCMDSLQSPSLQHGSECRSPRSPGYGKQVSWDRSSTESESSQHIMVKFNVTAPLPVLKMEEK